MRRAAIVLCGGRSRRMGRDKATLPFGPGGTLLGCVIARLREALPTEPIMCVAAAGQRLPTLPAGVEVAPDRTPDLGPLEGLATGLRQIKSRADAALAVGCDAPLLSPAVVRLLFDRLIDADAAVARAGDRLQPLLAVYATGVSERVDATLTENRRSLMAVLQRLAINHVEEADLRGVDPPLHSLENCNTEAAYRQALAIAGHGAPNPLPLPGKPPL